MNAHTAPAYGWTDYRGSFGTLPFFNIKRVRVTYLDEKGWVAHMAGWVRWDANYRATFAMVLDDGSRYEVVGALVAVMNAAWRDLPGKAGAES